MKKLSIKETQNLTFDALCYVDNICQKYGIKYYLAYGTLLGAVREHDFIPWDDDIDIWMKRDDYNHFANIMKTEVQDHYFYQSVITDPLMPAPAEARICINGTLNNPQSSKKLKYRQGIWIDIFPLDTSIYNKNNLSKRTKVLKTIQKLIVNKHRSLGEYSEWRGAVKHTVLNIIPYRLLVLIEKYIIGKKAITDKDFLVDYAASWAIGDNPLRFQYMSKWFEDCIPVEFHGKKFPCPKGYNDILNQRYGENYMTPIKDGRTPYPKYLV